MTPTGIGSAHGRPQASRPGVHDRWKRSGLSHGCPSGTTPDCSAISRSKRESWGIRAASDGKEAPTRVESRPTAPSPSPAATTSYPPAALASLRSALEAYARVGNGLAIGLVDQDAARRLALAKARAVAQAYFESREALGFPMLNTTKEAA